MRIAIVTISPRRIGGVEEYLGRVIPELERRGHDVAVSYEMDAPVSHPRLSLPDSVMCWNHSELGQDGAIEALRRWRPDIIYCNGISDAPIQMRFSEICPAVFSVHTYWGTCVSGFKSFRTPTPRPCDRRFGPACLVNYFPRRCGGLNPLSMIQAYSTQSLHLRALQQYAAVVVHSEHMLRECAAHDVQAEKIYCPLAPETTLTPNVASGPENRPWRFLFLGRMTKLKGVSLALDALAIAQPRLGAPIELTLAGDGQERLDLEGRAQRLSAAVPGVTCNFVGWVSEARRDELLASTDLLVVPSVFPEPFGMVGLEAAAHGVPAVAFAVGGIPEWLREGVNGALASGAPPTPGGLADAIVRSVAEKAHYARLRAGARSVRQEFAQHDAVTELVRVFDRVRRPL